MFQRGETLETPEAQPPVPTISISPQSLPWYCMDGGVPEEVMRYERTDRSEGATYTLNRPPIEALGKYLKRRSGTRMEHCSYLYSNFYYLISLLMSFIELYLSNKPKQCILQNQIVEM